MQRPYKRLFDHPDFEVPVPSRQSVVGFLMVIAIAASMIAALNLFVKWVLP